MKILVVSDTHSFNENLELVVQKIGTPDCLLHMGDAECSEEELQQITNCPVHVVSGNCDFFCGHPRMKIVELEGHKIMLTHGHYYYVAAGIRDLAAAAKENGCDIALFGHTHKPFEDQSDPTLTVLNPGSLSQPRQADHRPSYILMELEAGQRPVYEICYL